MTTTNNNWIIIQAYKHNGELHRQWSHGFLVEENDNYYMVASVRSSVVESDGRVWHTREPALMILSKKEWFNVIAMLKEDGITYYVNVASPTIKDKGFLKYIDYDLDVKKYHDGSTRLLDVSEYKKHAEELNYPSDVKDILTNAVDNILVMMDKKKFPFVDSEIYRLYQEFLDKTR